MSFTPFTYQQHLKFLLDTLRVQLPNVDLSTGSFWQIWAQGQSRGLAGVTSGLNYTLRQILPDAAVALDLDHHAGVYDLPREQPQQATGQVVGTATQPYTPSSPPVGLHLEDHAGRAYDIDDLEGFSVPFAGTFDLSITAREAGAEGNQVTDAPLAFKPAPPPGIDAEVRVLSPGIAGGTDLETDAALQSRIITTLSAGRLTDAEADYQRWARATPTFLDDDDERFTVEQVWVYQDQSATNRVYLLPLSSPSDRIGPPGFCQAVFNTVERSIPVTVDHIVPVILAEEIDVELAVRPRASARWDWFGTKQVKSAQTTDRVIKLNRGPDTVLPDVEWDGADGLRAGLRVLINGDQRQIGHVDHEDDTITLTDDLSTIPANRDMVYPGGPVTDQVQQAIRALFEVVTPIHRAAIHDLSPQNVLASAITDTVMELADVYDVEVLNAETLLDSMLLTQTAYLQGTQAYLAVPGAFSVTPMDER